MKNTLKQLLSALLLLTIFSCEDTTIVKNYTGTGEEKTYSIEGYAQKGPFIVGSNVTVSELNDELYPTGKVFFATILDNQGHFELPGVVLTSPYIQIKVEGSYFSEISGGVPVPGNLTLYSLADITDSQSINVNILTHLEKERVEYLVQEESMSFAEAKEQSLEELLSVFSLDSYSVGASEELSILSDSEGNAVLLTISSVIEGVSDYERRLALITNFQNDFQDGTLDNVAIQNTLLTSAFSVEKDAVINNLTTRFSGITVPDFEPVLNHFKDNSSYTNYFSEVFVRTNDGSVNLLDINTPDEMDPAKNFILYVNPPQGVEVIIDLMITGSYYSDEASFNGSSPVWMENASGGSCPPEPDPHCFMYSSHRLYLNSTNLNTLEIPITSFSGNGVLGVTFTLYIDGFSNRSMSFARNFNW